MSFKIPVIPGSVRRDRVGLRVARFVAGALQGRGHEAIGERRASMSKRLRYLPLAAFPAVCLLACLTAIRAGEPAAGRESPSDSGSAYPTASIVVQYRDPSGRETRDPQVFEVTDAGEVAHLASHFPGILGERGSGPRASASKKAALTIKFNHKSGDPSRLRVAHVSPDYATWWWRDNTPYTGDRQVEGKEQLRELIERLAAKNKVHLK